VAPSGSTRHPNQLRRLQVRPIPIVQVQHPLDYTDHTCVGYVEHAKHALEIYQAFHDSIDDQTPAAQKEIRKQYLEYAKTTYERVLEDRKIQDDEAEEEDVAMTNADASTEETEDSGGYALDEPQVIFSSDDEDPEASDEEVSEASDVDMDRSRDGDKPGVHDGKTQEEATVGTQGGRRRIWTGPRRAGEGITSRDGQESLVVVSSLHRTVIHAT
jgi:hypothetical protein